MPINKEQADVLRLLQKLHTTLDRDPILLDLVRRSESSSAPWPLRAPEDVLGLQRWVAWQASHSDVVDFNGPWTAENRLRLATSVLNAPAYLWRSITEEAASGVEMPEHIVSRKLLMAPRMFFCFEHLWGIRPVRDDGTEAPGTYILAGLLVADSPEGIVSWSIALPADDNPMHCTTDVIGYDTRYTPRKHPAQNDKVLGLLTFLSSPYIPKEERRLDRRYRTSLGRQGWHEDKADRVTFVDLRAAITENEQRGHGTAVAWKHRWIVRGHIRAQWYPSEGAHRPIWVPPHMKGPEDAPMLTHAYRVVR